ncbi:MAG: hypothetical protein A2487_18295 [Candidatus Raymondbacteria bacterium RifOxyC12_full_50_8]|uniref:Uncharacterized protein n=1 Tax=Candidatus Raymondbacteria bacterium RIFOXYD12_FULL_49_13 TaxID=1817890 RepID=A0A1F7F5A0_UNCRA|nr:MAG: hypothetical protein A2350_08335 [Candidatus Raymondbacteria bacterium RifOxyB12_full_50_8]OGJ87167.1 MAG: hypothetical protein A2248_03990 [Candidatus Raymondbacteria bacterium RIFOXYA2_FULL_49_16]OGJ95352.1 MAG: hypothetical protein A2487_18295 [Candidatus Raymondbacteria bacterium RifOxyC12_full_50_8]OGK01830.1 MAG: hypothetical protein A2519_03135 [Candidatus Raymondbacteria bacterium RIFOXYD12_FULL_49_13]OGP41163.1 MAG: hypothetical protein A2324_08635 [Candidatus Raymondbacteria b
MAAKKVFQDMMRDFGEVRECVIDSQSKRVVVSLHLKGEAESWDITLGDYEIRTSDGKTYIRFNSIEASREWIRLVFERFLRMRSFEIPGEYASLIEKLV